MLTTPCFIRKILPRASWDYYAIITPEKEINIYFS